MCYWDIDSIILSGSLLGGVNLLVYIGCVEILEKKAKLKNGEYLLKNKRSCRCRFAST